MGDYEKSIVRGVVFTILGITVSIFAVILAVAALSRPSLEAQARCESLNGTYGGGKCYIDGVEK